MTNPSVHPFTPLSWWSHRALRVMRLQMLYKTACVSIGNTRATPRNYSPAYWTRQHSTGGVIQSQIADMLLAPADSPEVNFFYAALKTEVEWNFLLDSSGVLKGTNWIYNKKSALSRVQISARCVWGQSEAAVDYLTTATVDHLWY